MITGLGLTTEYANRARRPSRGYRVLKLDTSTEVRNSGGTVAAALRGSEAVLVKRGQRQRRVLVVHGDGVVRQRRAAVVRRAHRAHPAHTTHPAHRAHTAHRVPERAARHARHSRRARRPARANLLQTCTNIM